jgi:hypothetical protein
MVAVYTVYVGPVCTGFDVQCNHYKGPNAQEIMQISAFS